MKLIHIILSVAISLLTISANAQKQLHYNDFQTIETEIESKYFDFKRKIIIGLPPDYSKMTAQNYDVMYVFDAQDRPYFDLTRSLPVFINTKYETRFIIVGVLSPQDMEYSRQDDFLKMKYPSGHGGNYKNFSMFIRDDLMPYIAKNYRTTDRSIAVGHSLGGSFALDALMDYELFDDLITISPNMWQVDGTLSNNLISFDYKSFTHNHFIFTTDANEEYIQGWENWKPARENVYNFFDTQKPTNVTFYHQTYPQANHMTTVPDALIDGLRKYLAYRDSVDEILTNKELEVKITLISNHPVPEVYITGNQDALNNWNAKGVKMKAINDTTFTTSLRLKLPAQFKFTRGTWQTEAFIRNSSVQGNQFIETTKRNSYTFAVQAWNGE